MAFEPSAAAVAPMTVDGEEVDLARKPVGAGGGPEAAVLEDKAVVGHLEQLRRDGLRLRDQIVGRHDQRRAAEMQRAGAAMAAAAGHARRVGLHQIEGLDRQSKFCCRDLREGGLVALTVGLRTDRHVDRAVLAHPQPGFLIGLAARGFEKAADAETAKPAALPGGAPACGEAYAVGCQEHRVEIVGEGAAVDRGAEGGAIGEGADEVAPAQFCRIHAELVRGLVDQPLDQVVRLGLAGAAIGVDGRGVGEDATHIHDHRRDVVEPAHGGRGRIGGAAGAERGDIGAEIGDGLDVEREDAAAPVEREPRGAEIVAAVNAAGELLDPLGAPAHRLAMPTGGPEHQRIFRIGDVLHAEAAADIGAGELDPVERQAEHTLRQLLPDGVDRGAAEFEMIDAAFLVVAANSDARFERGRDDAVVDEVAADDMRRFGESLRDGGIVAAAEAEGDIARRLRPDLDGFGSRRAGEIGDGRQDVVINGDLLAGFPGCGQRVGHHEGNGIADMADDAMGQRQARRHDQRLDGGDRDRGRQRAEPVEIGRRVDAAHAGQGCSGAGIDRDDRGMGMGRAQNGGAELAV